MDICYSTEVPQCKVILALRSAWIIYIPLFYRLLLVIVSPLILVYRFDSLLLYFWVCVPHTLQCFSCGGSELQSNNCEDMELEQKKASGCTWGISNNGCIFFFTHMHLQWWNLRSANETEWETLSDLLGGVTLSVATTKIHIKLACDKALPRDMWLLQL